MKNVALKLSSASGNLGIRAIILVFCDLEKKILGANSLGATFVFTETHRL